MPNKLIKTYGTTPPLTMTDRYRIICEVLDLRYTKTWFDDKDLTYFIKVLLENGIVRISEEAYRLSAGGKNLWKGESPAQWIDFIHRMLNGMPQTDYLQEKIDRSKYAWEHIAPTKVLIEEVKSLYVSKKLNLKKLSLIIDDYGTVCVITKSEDKKLGKKLRYKMPAGWKFGDSALCRYDSAGIILKQP
jgi:hypothetical protein